MAKFDSKPVAAGSHRYGCVSSFGMSDPSRGPAGDIAEYCKNVIRTPMNFIKRSKVQHTVEVDELSGHAINVSAHTSAQTEDLKKELNW